MEGSQFLQTPPSSEQDEEVGARVVEEDDEVVIEDHDEGMYDAEDERYCVDCGHSLQIKEKGPKCYPCYSEARDIIHQAHKKPMSSYVEGGSCDEGKSSSRSRGKKLPGSSARARKIVKRVLDEDEDSDVPAAGHPDDVPDLGAYFALFKGFSELDQVVYCRAYATMLSTKSTKNRMRYSKKAGEKWANKR